MATLGSMSADALLGAVPWAVIIIGTTAVVLAYQRGELSAALGITFVLASITRFGVPIAGSTLRFEQPAILILFGLILLRDAGSLATVARRSIWFIAFGAIYLGAHLLSSATIAIAPLESLKIAGWLAISMLGGAVAAVVAYRSGGVIRLAPWVVGAALLHIGVAIMAVTSQIVLDTNWGVQHDDVLIGKAQGLAHEANLFGILIAMSLPFAILPAESGGIAIGRAGRVAIIAALALGLGLGYSRGAFVAFAAAAVAIATLEVWRRGGTTRTVVKIAVPAALTLLVAAGTIQVQDAFARAGARDTNNLIVIDVPAPSPRESPQSTPDAAEPSSTPEVVGTGDTVAVRMRSITAALDAFPDSPIIGHGTDAMRQAEIEITCQCPMHIGNLPVATIYEAGIVGTIGLVGLVVLVLLGAVRLSAVALFGAIIAMLVGYLVTDALRFGLNWILLGVIPGALAVVPPRRVR